MILDPVLLCNELGVDTSSTDEQNVPRTSLSVKEAVQIAKDNNFMGLICNHEMMVGFCLSTSTLIFLSGISQLVTCQKTFHLSSFTSYRN